MKRNILLVEPNYKNKYPPLGLMKISAYHKLLGDNVRFVKGLSVDIQKQKWDRVYVTTLFSFYWKETIKTIDYYKNSVTKKEDFNIGGIMATIMADEIEEETGIAPHKGLLDKPGQLGDDRKIIVDSLIPDYDILNQIEYKYPESDAYFIHFTRGCPNKCKFCAVPKLEPKYNHLSNLYIKRQIEEIDRRFGKKKVLMVMDNNILNSKNLDEIVETIKEIGFDKTSKVQATNLYELIYNRFTNGDYDDFLILHLKEHINNFIESRIAKYDDKKEEFLRIINNNKLLSKDNKEFVSKYLEIYELLKPYFDRYRIKSYRQRYVDFNQGIDARLMTDERTSKITELNIKPMRIAFDDIKFKKIYSEKIRLAAKYGQRSLSNYILYNYKDSPEELYERLRINIELNKELNIDQDKKYRFTIFSFPMKYVPVSDKDRTYIGKKWTKKELRAIKVITNVTHGAVMPGSSFFYTAFGKNLDEFHKITLMPEEYIVYRKYCSELGFIEKWENDYNNLKQHSRYLFNKTIKFIKNEKFRRYKLTSVKNIFVRCLL